LSQAELIKDLAKYGLEKDQARFMEVLTRLIDYSKKTKKINFALQLQSILRESIINQQENTLTLVNPQKHLFVEESKEINDFIIEKLLSEYRFDDLICTHTVKEELKYFIKEHSNADLLKTYQLPISNKVLFFGPSGCGKTLASYVLAGELQKVLLVVNLGAIVSSKLGETSKNLAKVFKKTISEESIVFLDEFDSLGKVRDYSQDHGEMKRVVNTILQLFDYLPPESILVAATNQVEMIDVALLRRFDMKVYLGLPTINQILELINKILKNNLFVLDDKRRLKKIVNLCVGLSFYTIQKTLIATIKRKIFDLEKEWHGEKIKIDTNTWIELIEKEKKNSNSVLNRNL